MLQYAHNLGLALDKLLNALLLGDPDELLSRRCARAAYAHVAGFWHVCRLLDRLFGPHHCYLAEEAGSAGRELWHWSNNYSKPVLVYPPGGDPAPPAGSV